MSPVPVPLFMAPGYPRAAGHSTALASRVPSVSPDRYNTVCEKPISSTNPLALGWTWLGMAANKDERALEPLAILVADGKGQRLEEVTRTVASLGHDLVGQASLSDIAPLTASLRPDAAIVIVGESSEHALDLIGRGRGSRSSRIRTSSAREKILSFVKTFRRWYSMVRGHRNSSAAASLARTSGDDPGDGWDWWVRYVRTELPTPRLVRTRPLPRS
jgi:hypothetical protein